jgi:hypothetical protein
MRIPRIVLVPLCALLVAGAYYLVLFTNLANPYRGGTFRGTVLTDAVAVLAAFACLEVVRTERIVAIRALAGAFGAPLLLVIGLTLWYGLARYVAA